MNIHVIQIFVNYKIQLPGKGQEDKEGFEEEEKYEEMKLGQNWENMLRKKIELVSKL